MIAKKYIISLFSLFIGIGFASCTLQMNNATGPMKPADIKCNPTAVEVTKVKSTLITITGRNMHDDVRVLVAGVEVPHEEVSKSFEFTDSGEQVAFHFPSAFNAQIGPLDVTIINPKVEGPVPSDEDSVIIKGCLQITNPTP